MSLLEWGAFICILMHLESGNDPNARGDGGNAYGVLQIHEACVEDVNRIYKLNDTGYEYYHWDAWNVKKSKEICKKYLSHWGEKYKEEAEALGQSTFETYARIWNGGPRGYKKEATDKYWERFIAKANELGVPIFY